MVTSNLGSTGGQAQGHRVVTPRMVTTSPGWLERVKTCCPWWDPTSQSPCTIFLHAERVAFPLHADGVGAQSWLRGQREGQIHDSLPRGHLLPLRDAIPAGILQGTRGISARGAPQTAPGCVLRPSPEPTPPPGCPKQTFRNTKGSWKAKRGWSEEQFHFLGSHWGGWGREWGFLWDAVNFPALKMLWDGF